MRHLTKSFLIVIVMTIFVRATTLQVPGDYSTIQPALNAASSGDTVLVADENYTGSNNRNLVFEGRSIILMSENGPDNCIINCQFNGNGFIFEDEETENAVVDGFRIINGSGYSDQDMGGAIFIDGASPTLRNLIIDNCSVGDGGGGIYLYNSESLMENITITNCSAVSGGGIAIIGDMWDQTEVVLRNSSITINTATCISGMI